MRIFHIQILLFLFLFVNIILANSQSDVKSDISRNKILIGEKAIISISANADNNSKVIFPEYDSLSEIIPGIEVLSQVDTIIFTDTKSIYKRKYQITSFDSANYSIPSFNVKINNVDLKTPPISLKVETVEIDTTHVDKIYDLKKPMEPPFDINEWLFPIILSLLSFIISLILIYIIIRIKDNKPIIRRFKLSAYIPPHKTALEEIDKMRYDENTNILDNKQYYTQLTDILRKYIYRRYGFNALEMTTQEIVSHLEEFNDQSAINELRSLFSTADLVKFAKAQPDLSENDTNLINAITYIQRTKKEEVTEQTPKEIVVEDVRSKKTKKILYTCITITSIILLITIIYLLQYIYILKY